MPTIFTTITMTKTSSYEWKILEWNVKPQKNKETNKTNKQNKQTNKQTVTVLEFSQEKTRHIQGRVHFYCMYPMQKVKGSTSLFAKCPVVIFIKMLNWRRKLYVRIYI